MATSYSNCKEWSLKSVAIYVNLRPVDQLPVVTGVVRIRHQSSPLCHYFDKNRTDSSGPFRVQVHPLSTGRQLKIICISLCRRHYFYAYFASHVRKRALMIPERNSVRIFVFYMKITIMEVKTKLYTKIDTFLY